MIQQPMYQELSETPDYQQQMMLCPVRVVYDTQMFLQQGEQLQQNQYVINPQNPPPWIQNQVQNQVIYVQNVPNNYMQAYQQPIDPNQFQNYGYSVPQMLVPAAQDPRHIQMIPANLVPNINVNQRVVPQNIAMPTQIMVNEVQNQIGQNQTEAIQSNLANEMKQEISSQAIHQMPVYQAEQKLPMQQTLPAISNLQPRLPQFDQNHVRQVHPQIITPNVRPNYQIISQNVPANMQPNYQTVVTQTQKVPPIMQQNYQPIVTQKVSPINKTNYQVVSGNSQPIYKAIQPRPNQFNNQQIKQLPTQNILYMNSIRRNNTNNAVSAQIITPAPNFVKIDSSRKRKSESPEEIHNKVVIPNQSNIVIKQEPISKPAVEIVSNPNSLLKSENKTVVNSLQITPIDTQNVKIKEELAKPVRNISFMEPKLMIRKKMMNNIEAIQSLSPTSVQDKLVRNTVYMQARGRLISDQQDTIKNVIPNPTQTENADSKLSEKDKTEIANKNSEENKLTEDNDKEIKTECVDNTREKDGKSFLLTHVLDGYVIQESNMAFPIRRPLKEKTLRMSTEAIDPIREFIEKKKVETRAEKERLLDISQMDLKESKKSKEEQDIKDPDNPFEHINPSDVKTWTVDQLSAHLKKFGWDETISLLQDHEIDGESLSLVSKTQLMKIGISEEHSSIICDFIKS